MILDIISTKNQHQYDPDYNTVYCFKPTLDNDMARQRKLYYLMEIISRIKGKK